MKYKFWLHKVGTSPTSGFGYHEPPFEKVEQWNSYTQETCPHIGILDRDTCQLCGNKYEVTALPEPYAFGETVKA